MSDSSVVDLGHGLKREYCAGEAGKYPNGRSPSKNAALQCPPNFVAP